MKYDKPIMELIIFETDDVIRTSGLNNGGYSDNEDNLEGPWAE